MMSDWKLKEPQVELSKGEREWFDWALSGAQEALDDENWLADNDDALTVEGQIEDMRYRLEEQGHDMLESLAREEERTKRRTLNSLNKRLKECGYYDPANHA